MNNVWFQFSFPPQNPGDWVATATIGIIAASIAIFYLLKNGYYAPNNMRDIQKWMGLERLPLILFSAGFALWSILIVVLFAATSRAAANMTELFGFDPTTPNNGIDDNLKSFATLLAGLGAAVAFPITLIRLRISAEQNEREKLRAFHDRFASAVAGLAAMREVTRKSKEGDLLPIKESDLFTRIAAIQRLFDLVTERPSEAPFVSKILCDYIQLQSTSHSYGLGEVAAEPPPHENPITRKEITEVSDWARRLKSKRRDVEFAAQIIGSLQKIEGVKLKEFRIAFHKCNLQGCDLSNLDFSNSHWFDCRLENANFLKSDLTGSLFDWSELVWVKFIDTNLNSAKFIDSTLDFAEFRGGVANRVEFLKCDLNFSGFTKISMTGSDFNEIEVTNANFRNVDMRGSRFSNASQISKTWFAQCSLTGAAVESVSLDANCNLLIYSETMFGDGKSRNELSPKHWPTDTLFREEFYRAWRDWVAKEHPDVFKYLPDYVRNA